ncbi:PLP-dependent transferase [Lindgomyces ingoldianus]|uniref:PLP-dependent transferase n=1 Tax=Lindgomyces ingoldianus TaxID=673940 RepID=A0ACB6QQ48_9PLEO|nr:PLP-dependent transferase [Lindgomyces ingoldianus]KAF2469124.1 PLP-dependent transferase [Lindgomyces ingoldianus]
MNRSVKPGGYNEAAILSLGPGAPSPEYFPFDHTSLRVPSAREIAVIGPNHAGVTLTANKDDTRAGRSDYDLSSALQYGVGTGARQLLDFMTQHTKQVHNPPYQDWKCVITGGNTSALDLALRTFTDRGSYVLADEYTYATAFECARPLGVKILGIKLDEEGPIPSELDRVLTGWDEDHMESKKPHLIYMVPTGHNPTGATQSLERRHEIYRLAQKHDLYILEDDPYYYIQLPANVSEHVEDVTQSIPFSVIPKTALLPSLLSIDTDGRVFRMDSFSKILAPGLRTGWVTASSQVVERIVRAHETSLQNPSGFSQIVLYKLLSEAWGQEGLMCWLSHLQIEYTIRRDALLRACELYLPAKVASWKVPRAGFFMWIKINWLLHPLARQIGQRGVEMQIYDTAIKAGVLVVPGTWFQPDPSIALLDVFFRITYASLTPDVMPEAVERFGEALRSCFEVLD